MSSAMRSALTALFVTLLVLFSSASVSAYCVYNHTDKTLRVRGGSCFGCFDQEIKPGDHKCCPGDEHGCGSRYISILASSFHPDQPTLEKLFAKTDCAMSITRPYYAFTTGRRGAPHANVPAHGWISIYSRIVNYENTPYGVIKDEHGKIHWEGFAGKWCGAFD